MESIHSVGESTKNSHERENHHNQIISETKDSLDHILGRKILPNISKTPKNIVIVNVDGMKYYVAFIPKKYNFDSGYETENKMVMDAWSMIDATTSAGVLFVSGPVDAPYIQQVIYDKHKDQIFFQQTDDMAIKALNQAFVCE